MTPHPLIYDWNHDAAGPHPFAMLDDETFRDGLQSPSVRTPTIDEKIGLVGREQEIDVGPMSGRSNVVFWLERRGLAATDEIVDRVFAAAKASRRMLTRDQIERIVEEVTGACRA